jgi:3-isopropylmalate/(R)-2-methylmalate dehydratase small subunit
VNPVSVIRGPISVLRRNDVDTDQIIPKQFLKRVERTGFGEYLFYDWAKEPGWDLDPNPILVTGRNFGCGSSREHAPWALEDFGFKAIDLEAQVVRFDRREARFEIDPETKRRLLEGLDDIGVTLRHADAIDRYERERERTGPVTTSL